MTKQEAIAFYDAKKYEKMTDEEIVKFQLYEPLLCMPFEIFHGALERVLNRPIQTIEFADNIKLQLEFEKKIPPQNSLDNSMRILKQKNQNAKVTLLMVK